ncbi:trypsin-like peptidase domain-containing protein [Pseudomonas putida]|uniref:RNA-directed DNA polymerase n=1 Tax=Pseudomonas putida TaxID=303 RepID=A0ABD7BB36_PSEPU|nr:trypsin-like peptidase domain-containing protein [Pseudomonas putida]QOC97322.1 trypsin-like peptidase domain-containing protein [Pseudomonas putida]
MSKLNSSIDVDELAGLLGTSYGKIRYYYYSKPIPDYYKTFEISKKSGGVRVISAPHDQLKVLQERLKILLDELYTPKSSAMAFIKGRSIVENAKQHTRKKFVFNLDLSDFFSSITFPRVRGLLMAKPYSLQSGVATVIAHLCTLNGILPQGSPCSPVLSNMICSGLDRQLKSFAIKHRARYSRYADDITFSFYDDLNYISPDMVSVLMGDGVSNHYYVKCGRPLVTIIESCGFGINLSKVRLQGRYERQIVTGLVVNKKVNVERSYIRKTSAMIHAIETKGLGFARERFAASNPPVDPDTGVQVVLDAHLHGRLLFIKQVVGVESEVYRRLAMRFNFLDLNFKLPLGVSKNRRGVEFRRSTPWYDKRCWIVETELDLEFGQGSAFFVADNVLVTCSHVSEFTGRFTSESEVYRANARGKKYNAGVVYRDKARDISILKLNDESLVFEKFEISTRLADVGDVLSVLGFPNDKLGAQHAGRQTVVVRNKFSMSGVQYFEVDKELYAGNSGGPVLDEDNNLVGVVAKGNDGHYCDHSRFICVSELLVVLEDYKKAILQVSV